MTRHAVAEGTIAALGPGAGGIMSTGNVLLRFGKNKGDWKTFHLPADELKKLRIGQRVRIEFLPVEEGGES